MESLLSGGRGWGCYLGLRILGLDYNRTFPEDYFRSDHWWGSRGITSHRFTWLESMEATLLGKVSLERRLNGRWPQCKMHQDHFGVLLPPSWWPQVRAHYWHKYWGQFNRYNPSMQVIGVNIEPFTLKKRHNLTQTLAHKHVVVMGGGGGGFLTQCRVSRRPTLCAAAHFLLSPFHPYCPTF